MIGARGTDGSILDMLLLSVARLDVRYLDIELAEQGYKDQSDGLHIVSNFQPRLLT